jgi:hypothetical protein
MDQRVSYDWGLLVGYFFLSPNPIPEYCMEGMEGCLFLYVEE